MYTKEYKEQVYQKWLANGRPWFHIDKSKEPTADERQIILEMKKVHETPKSKSKRDLDIEQRASLTEKNMAALISTENDVQAKKIDLSDAVIEPGQEDSFSPNKMIDVTIIMNKQVEPNTEVMACVLQLGSGTFSQQINCNTVYSEGGNTGKPQKIIVPLA